MNNVQYDVIIIGGGPAGLTAGIYTSREMLTTLLLEKGLTGGLPVTTEWIENYPGFPDGIKGIELMEKFKMQAEHFGTDIVEFKEIRKVEILNGKIKVYTDKEQYLSYALIVASGSIPKRLNIPGEKEFMGKGVSYCATCDGPLFKDKDIAIIGCGNSGLQEGEALVKYVRSITFIEFLPYMPATRILQERLQPKKNTKFLLNHTLTSINGDTKVTSVTVKDRKTDVEKKINVSGVFIYVGFLPNSKFLEGIVEIDKDGYIVTDEKMETSLQGIYAIGDVRSKQIRQITLACAEGTVAALSVRDYVNEIKKKI